MKQDPFSAFFQTFDRILKNIKRIAAPVMRSYGLRSVHTACILALSRQPDGMTVTELSRECMIDKAMSSRIIKELLGGGFIAPAPGSNKKNYNQRYMLTSKMSEVTKELYPLIECYVREAAKNISAEEIAVFNHVLAELDRNIEAMTESKST